MGVALDIELAPVTERLLATEVTQRPERGIPAEYVRDLDVDQVRRVDGSGGIVHPAGYSLAGGGVQHQLDRTRSIQDEQGLPVPVTAMCRFELFGAH